VIFSEVANANRVPGRKLPLFSSLVSRDACLESGTMSRIPVYLLLGIALLAGCGPREDYVRPDPPLPLAWPETGTPGQALRGRPPASIGWREFFPDAKLKGLIALALENNRDLRLGTARLQEARAQYGLSEADRLPTVSLVGSNSTNRVSGSLTSSKAQDTRRTDLNISLLSFELDFWGRLASLSDAARASYLATEAGQQASRLSLIAEVANAYFAVVEADERRSITLATLAAWEQTVEVTKSGREFGAATKLDVLLVEGALASNRVELAAIERQRGNALNALNLLVGTTAVTVPEGDPLRLQRMSVAIAAGIPAETLMQRPDIIAAEQRLIAAHANIAAVRAAFFPRVVLTAGLGLASPALATLFNSSSQSWNFQPSISMPLFDGGRSAGNLDVAVARREVAVADYEKTIQQAFREVADLLAAQTTYAAQRAANEALTVAREERAQAIRARYRAGAASLLEVLEATRAFHDSQQSLVQVQRAHLSSTAQLFKALGGGEG
jgi:multidrug efflux system outer membrane protein